MEIDNTKVRCTEIKHTVTECKEMDSTHNIKLIDMTHTIITIISDLVFMADTSLSYA